MTKKEIESAVAKYHITISDGNLRIPGTYVADVQRDNMLDALKENKPAILAYLMEKQEEEEKARGDRKEKIKAIEGLDEIMECRRAWNVWHDAFDRMMETESSIMTVPKPAIEEWELRDRYPRANAYLIAEKYSNKSNFELAAIGERALERIINGEDYLKVMEDMDSDRKAFALEHIND